MNDEDTHSETKSWKSSRIRRKNTTITVNPEIVEDFACEAKKQRNLSEFCPGSSFSFHFLSFSLFLHFSFNIFLSLPEENQEPIWEVSPFFR